MLNGLDLFSGIGGLALALAPWVRTVAYCERDTYAQAVLLSRMAAGELHAAPIWDDVCSLQGIQLPRVDIITGGFPCQDLSVAGLKKGLAGERSGLFFEIMRLAEETKPAYIFLENVPGVRKHLGVVGWELSRRGYDCRWGVISAYDVGAPHQRDRWFCLAHASSKRRRLQQRRVCGTHRKNKAIFVDDGIEKPLANPTRARLETREHRRRNETQDAVASNPGENVSHTTHDGIGRRSKQPSSGERTWSMDWWATEPDVDRVVDGLPHRVDRIRCLGNAVVPQQAREAFKRLSGIGEMK